MFPHTKESINATLALNDVSLEIYDNDFVALVGETGSGKSTLVQCFNGLIIPIWGIVVDDFIVLIKIVRPRLKNLRKRVGLVFNFRISTV